MRQHDGRLFATNIRMDVGQARSHPDHKTAAQRRKKRRRHRRRGAESIRRGHRDGIARGGVCSGAATRRPTTSVPLRAITHLLPSPGNCTVIVSLITTKNGPLIRLLCSHYTEEEIGRKATGFMSFKQHLCFLMKGGSFYYQMLNSYFFFLVIIR